MPQVILVERSMLCAMAEAGNVLELPDNYYLGVTLISLLQLFQLPPASGITMEFLWLRSYQVWKIILFQKFFELTFFYLFKICVFSVSQE